MAPRSRAAPRLCRSCRCSTPTSRPGSGSGCKGRCWSASSPTGASSSPGFQVLFVLQTAPGELPRLPGVEVEPLPLPGDTAKFDLTLSLAETTEGLAGDLEYDRGLFDAATVRRMVGHLRILLAGAVA